MMVGKMNIEWTPTENLALPPSLATTTTEHLKDRAAACGLHSYLSITHCCTYATHLLNFRTFQKSLRFMQKTRRSLKLPQNEIYVLLLAAPFNTVLLLTICCFKQPQN